MSDILFEQELIINGNEEETMINIYTASKRIADKYLTRGYMPVRVEKCDGNPCGWFFELPRWTVAVKLGKNYVRQYPKPKAKPST
jgi:hypothetical protein